MKDALQKAGYYNALNAGSYEQVAEAVAERGDELKVGDYEAGGLGRVPGPPMSPVDGWAPPGDRA